MKIHELKILLKLLSLSDNEDDPVFINHDDCTFTNQLYESDEKKTVSYSDSSINKTLKRLIHKEYIEVKGNSIYLTDYAVHFKEIVFLGTLKFIFMSVIIPICVAYFTAIITLKESLP